MAGFADAGIKAQDRTAKRWPATSSSSGAVNHVAGDCCCCCSEGLCWALYACRGRLRLELEGTRAALGHAAISGVGKERRHIGTFHARPANRQERSQSRSAPARLEWATKQTNKQEPLEKGLAPDWTFLLLHKDLSSFWSVVPPPI